MFLSESLSSRTSSASSKKYRLAGGPDVMMGGESEEGATF